jgi:hypothetical protein
MTLTPDTPRLPATGRFNAGVVAAALCAYLLVAALAGRTTVNGGLGADGPAYAAMVTDRDLSQGSPATRVILSFPVAAVVPYALTHDVVASFAAVNAVAFALLVLAACLILETGGVDRGGKVVVAAVLVMLGVPTQAAIFVPGDPSLFGPAMLALAIALCGRVNALLLMPVHGIAALATPAGVAAPLYGAWRAVRTSGRWKDSLVAFAPALFAWAAWTYLARGRLAGVAEWAAPARLQPLLELWSDPAYVAFAAYFVATSLGGLSLLLLTRPRGVAATMREQPELWALLLPIGVTVFGAELEVAHRLALLIPVWILIIAAGVRRGTAGSGWIVPAALLIVTAVTQRPGLPVDNLRYAVDWLPYADYSGRVDAVNTDVWAVWTPRFALIFAAVAILALVDRVSRRPAARDAVVRAPTPSRPPVSRPSIRIAGAGIVDVVSTRWTRRAYACAAAVAVVLGIGLLGIPVQLSDSLANLVDVQDRSFAGAFMKDLQGGPYLRPALWGTIDLAAAVAGQHRYLFFRGIHVAQVLLLLVLVVRLLTIRRLSDAAVVPLCLAVVVGLHTFAGTVREAFPINTFLTVLLCCAAAVNLVQARPRLLVDVAAVAVLLFATLTVETGLLVWVVLVAGAVVGWRGVSRRGLVAATACAAAYFVLRFAFLDGSLPGLDERSTGFGFGGFERGEAQARFGSNPLPLYAYNVVSAMSMVLFAEPRGGTWGFTAGLLAGGMPAWQIVNVVTSTLTSLLIAAYVLPRLRRWRRLEFDEGDRLVCLFLAVLPANAAFAYVYVKDVVLSPAGLFYAVAVFAVVRALLVDAARSSPQGRAWVSAGALAVVAVLACGWSVRFVGVNYSLRQVADSVRNEWAYYDDWERDQGFRLVEPAHLAVKQALYEDAIRSAPRPPAWSAPWADELFDRTQ